MDSRARTTRNELFQELKPRCIELSQLALKSDGSPTSSKSLVQSTKKLLAVLRGKCERTDGVFDEKLADYVFFPLSQILQKNKKYTDSLSEVTIKCLAILLQYGWRKAIALDLAKQLLMLLTFVAGGVPGQAAELVPEELMVDAFVSLTALLRDLSHTPGGASCLVETATIPALGHCVAVMLDGITKGPSANAQIQALSALGAVWRCVKDLQTLSTFIPATISALTKCLMPSTGSRRSKKTIVTALEVLEHVLVTILSDIRTRTMTDEGKSTNTEPKNLTKAWLKATTGQIKLALSNIIRLRRHDSEEVRNALNKMCLTILDQCHDTFSESAPMLIETCMTLGSIDGEEGPGNTSLIDLATIHSDLGELIKTTIYNWVTSLPRIMQSNDETAKHIALNQLSQAQKLVTDLKLDSSILEDALVNSLRDSVTVSVEQSIVTVAKGVQEAEFDLDSQAAISLVSEKASSTYFRPIVMPEQSRKDTRIQLAQLLNTVGTREAKIKMSSEMLEYARGGSSGASLLSALWLSAQLLKSATYQSQDMDDFFSSAVTSSDEQEIVNQELFYLSLSTLSNADMDTDWRLQAIALEIVASTAESMKEGFRAELVDSLYPIAQLLGSPAPQLREHAITCLNIVSSSCGYPDASELIIDNVDYMVNAVSLRLNTFDISPQTPQVLIMMIRLTGPKLLLYLDDVVGSIFAALDNFHGYPRLVEVLFSVLSEIVSVGSKSNTLLPDIEQISHLKMPPPMPTIDYIIALITRKPSIDDEEPLTHEAVPQKPWKSAKALLDEAQSPPEEDEAEADQPIEIAKPPPTKTFTMLQNITRLGQHYLTNPSPILRAKLLTLISTAASSLQNDEDAFLPLVNDIWPVVIARLYDDEPFVAIRAAETISAICRAAGDFLASRIADEAPALLRQARRARERFESEEKRGTERGKYGEGSKMWDAMIKLMIAVVGFVKVDEDVFDEVVEVLSSVVMRKGVREVLEAINADAVWLKVYAMGREERERKLEKPVVDGFVFAELEVMFV
ncbi:armadillo-type protein [Calycina marina]|uniref:Armadillo-type protein n=1 Tax=Calycina marina TaxID=1763456 RepID=A0A9P7Z0Z6_9HELO|nr:armadillo-type protein [Calycina marina]